MPKIHHPVRLAKAFCSTKTFSRCALYAWNLEPQALCYQMQVDAPGRWGLHTYISFHAHHLCIHFLPCSCTFAFMSCPLILLTFCGIHLLHGPFIFARISLRFGFCTHFLPFQFHWLFHVLAFHLLRLKGKPTEKQNQDGISLSVHYKMHCHFIFLSLSWFISFCFCVSYCIHVLSCSCHFSISLISLIFLHSKLSMVKAKSNCTTKSGWNGCLLQSILPSIVLSFSHSFMSFHLLPVISFWIYKFENDI